MEGQSSCRLCRQERELRNSHILPEFLYDLLYDDKHTFLEIQPDGESNRVLQQGLRERLLCLECEQLLGKYERFASQLMFHKGGTVIRVQNVEYVQNVDYKQWRLFLLSLLWRMGESSLRAFKEVRLGPHSERLRRLLLAENPGEPHQYACTLMAIRHHREMLKRTLVTPYRMKLEGLTVYVLASAGFMWGFWVSSHISADAVRHTAIRKDNVLPIHPMDARTVDKFISGLAP